MQYIALLLAFFIEITLRPAYINSQITWEPIMIIFYLMIATGKNIPIIIPIIMLIISSIVTNNIVGLQALSLLVSYIVYNTLYAPRKNTTYTIKKIPNTTIAFASIFIVITFVKYIFLNITGYNTTIMLSTVEILINLSVFYLLFTCFKFKK